MVRSIFRQVLVGLSRLHSIGIIHRDVKPENVFLCADGRHPDHVKLIDLGIPDATVKEIEESLSPSSAALALLVSHVKEEALANELHRFSGAKLTRSTLSAESVQRLRSALAPES